jgi:hypothetical protein
MNLIAVLVAHVITVKRVDDSSVSVALQVTFADLADAILQGGIPVAGLLVFNNISFFGIVAVVSALALGRWHWKRVATFYLVAMAILLLWSGMSGNGVTGGTWYKVHRPLELQKYGTLTLPPMLFFWEISTWSDYGIWYPFYALPVAAIAGALVAMLPIFAPGRRYWLKRGMCPKCHYDLRGDLAGGCPECGWNRQRKGEE